MDPDAVAASASVEGAPADGSPGPLDEREERSHRHGKPKKEHKRRHKHKRRSREKEGGPPSPEDEEEGELQTAPASRPLSPVRCVVCWDRVAGNDFSSAWGATGQHAHMCTRAMVTRSPKRQRSRDVSQEARDPRLDRLPHIRDRYGDVHKQVDTCVQSVACRHLDCSSDPTGQGQVWEPSEGR
jgi:hypothetical protein